MEYAILFLPLIGALLGYVIKVFGDIYSEIVTTLFVSVAAILSIILFYNGIVYEDYGNYKIYQWIASGKFVVNASINIDPLSSIMLVVVSLVSALVHIYSIGYMSHDPDKPRFMCYLSLFTFAMFTLVVSDNFLQLFFGWEGVGLCSYLLIGFWHKKNSANNAAIKAFIVNRIGDFGFAIGIFLIFIFFGTLNYEEVFALAPNFADTEINFLGLEVNLITVTCLFLFIGAMGKSAQFFLHTWLPDAMEGPTPVSALIHAATMVTAGVFLVVRCSPIFEYSQVALNFVAIVGMITALFAASVAIVQNDIKKIVAYSTCSQLKALLFLGSGSVIHSLNDEQDVRNMGDLWKKMPVTWFAMVVGTLALTGFPFLSGFYSKDAIIEFAFLKGTNVGYFAAGIGIMTAVLTALYSWRLIFKTFHGKFNNKNLSKSEIHESGLTITIPLLLLVVGSIFSGFLFKEFLIGHEYNNFWRDSILILEKFDHSGIPLWLLVITPFFVTILIPVSFFLYIKKTNVLDGFVLKYKSLYNFLLNKWYFDELYNQIIIMPTKFIGSFFWEKGDIKIIDRLGPDGISKIIKIISNKSSKFQSGYIYDYAFIMLIGLSLLLTFFIFYK